MKKVTHLIKQGHRSIIGMGTAAIVFLITWTMGLGTWIIYAVVLDLVDISPAEAGIITGFLALPYTFVKLLNDRYPRPRKEKNNGNSSQTSDE